MYHHVNSSDSLVIGLQKLLRFFFIFFLLHFKFWGTCEEHARLLHRYTHSSVICCLPPHHLYLAFLLMLSLRNSPLPTVPPLFTLTDPSMWCSPPCVHVFSLFNTHLWVRTCSIGFSVVLVCWELTWLCGLSFGSIWSSWWFFPVLWRKSMVAWWG